MYQYNTRNLWNIDVDKGFVKKTQAVISFIEHLEAPQSFEIGRTKRFDRTIKEALAKDSANEMLEHIGYAPEGNHTILQ